MAIVVFGDDNRPLHFSEVNSLLPRPVHISTIHRWATQGVRDANGELVKLEACRLGARWMTNRRALQTFMERLNLTREPEAVHA